MSATIVTCPVCSSDRVSPEASYASFENHARFPGLGGTNWIGAEKDLTLGAKVARFCFECGYVMHFLDASQLAQLRAAFSTDSD